MTRARTLSRALCVAAIALATQRAVAQGLPDHHPVTEESKATDPAEPAPTEPTAGPEVPPTPAPRGDERAMEPEQAEQESPPAAGRTQSAETPGPPPPPDGQPPQTQFRSARPVTEDESEVEVTRAAAPRTAEPPIPEPVREPPPPPEPVHRAPNSALWTGVRLGWLFPFGTLWHDGFLAGGACCIYERRATSDYASSGPLFEVDLGARISRSYNVFATWERASLGAGDLDPDSFGGQKRGWSDLFGAGVRFSTDPDAIGLLMEIVLGYRIVQARWEDGTTLTMNDGFLDARIGIGADIRVTRWLSLTPLITLSSGSFNDGTWEGPTEEGPALGRFDERGQFGATTLHVGGHFDIY